MTFTTFQLGYCSANLKGTRSLSAIQATVKAKRDDGASVIGWQEAPAGHEIDALKVLGPDWATAQCAEVPISWMVDVWTLHGTPQRLLVHEGKSGITPARWIHIVNLQHRKTKQVCTFINTHVVHHIDNGGHPLNAGGKYAGQQARATKHFKMLRQAIENRTAPTFLCGDLNVDFESDRAHQDHTFPYYQLSLGGAKFAPAPGPTEGNRNIDWMVYKGSKVTWGKTRTMPGDGSDHRSVVGIFGVRVEIKEPSPPKPTGRPRDVAEILTDLVGARTALKSALPAPYVTRQGDVSFHVQEAINALLAPETS